MITSRNPPSVELRALAVSVPDRVLTNDYWRRNYPEVVARTEERLWMWKRPENLTEGGSEAFNREMLPFVQDPFRGVLKRRFLPSGVAALELEADAARQALAAAELGADEIDLLICTSFLPDSVCIGGATWLARELGLCSAAWNLETACSSNLVALTTAFGLIASGQHERILINCSCTYSKVTSESDPVCWGIGDAAVAMVVTKSTATDPADHAGGLLGSYSMHSGETCGAITYEIEVQPSGRPEIRLRPQKTASRLLRETSEPYLKTCTDEALRRAGLAVGEIDFFVFNTPLAWYASFCARVLGVDRRKTISVYPLYANVGPALNGLNLFHAAHSGRIRPGAKVLLYSVGSVSSCCAMVLRWGDVALGRLPEDVSGEEIEDIERDAIRLSDEAWADAA